jgi:hypothetical protein
VLRLGERQVDLFERVLIAAQDDGRLVNIKKNPALLKFQVAQDVFFDRQVDVRIGDALIIDKNQDRLIAFPGWVVAAPQQPLPAAGLVVAAVAPQRDADDIADQAIPRVAVDPAYLTAAGRASGGAQVRRFGQATAQPPDDQGHDHQQQREAQQVGGGQFVEEMIESYPQLPKNIF